MKKLKLIRTYFKLKKMGLTKEHRYTYYAINRIITFDEYDEYLSKKMRKEDK